MVKVVGIQNKGRTATCLLRGSNKLVLEEAERSLHDALCVVRCLVHKKFLIAGGASPEVELVTQLSKWAKTLQVIVSVGTSLAQPPFRYIVLCRYVYGGGPAVSYSDWWHWLSQIVEVTDI